MIIHQSTLILVLVTLVTTISASNILMILPLGSASHKNIFTPVAQQLGEKGHDVTLVSLHEPKSNPTTALAYREFVAGSAWEQMKAMSAGFNVFNMERGAKINSGISKMLFKNIHNYCDAFLRDPAVQEAWAVKPDLVMLPAFMNECGLAIVHKYQVPFIYVTTSGLTPWTADTIGNPEHPAYVPNQYLSYSDDMSLFERSINTIARVATPFFRRHFVLRKLDKVVQEFLEDPTVSLEDTERNTSLVLVNSHHSMGYPRPLLPNVIEVGGMHCRPAKSLESTDPELSHFLEQAMDRNVLYFSLGSQIRSSQMPDEILSIFVNTFNKLPFDVVWKWEGERPANLSSNVFLRKWLPQQDILGHPSTGAFLTHGGLLSFQEAAYHGVPLVAMPLMSDQFLNAKQIVSLGMGEQLSLEHLSEETLEKTIMTVMQNPSYLHEAQRRSVIMKDQETQPLNRAVYWTEYVLRHRGASHLKSQVTKLSIIQYYLLDVGAVLLITFVFLTTITLILMYITSKYFFRFCKTVLINVLWRRLLKTRLSRDSMLESKKKTN